MHDDHEAGTTSNHELDGMASTPDYGASSTDPLIRFHEQQTNQTASSTSEGSLRQRRTTFVSRHRKALDHISSDSLLSRRHPVPAHNDNARSHDNNNIESLAAHDDEPSSCCGKWARACQEKMTEKGPDEWLGTLIPMYKWLKGYPWKTALIQDLVAGLTVGVMIVPQSMSYAKLGKYVVLH